MLLNILNIDSVVAAATVGHVCMWSMSERLRAHRETVVVCDAADPDLDQCHQSLGVYTKAAVSTPVLGRKYHHTPILLPKSVSIPRHDVAASGSRACASPARRHEASSSHAAGHIPAHEAGLRAKFGWTMIEGNEEVIPGDRRAPCFLHRR